VPLVAEVDLLVVGGSSAAVAAAATAARAGQRVFLIAPRTYLGDDLCGHFRLWPETEDRPTALAKALFATVPPTPLHVKSTLQRELLAAGVALLLEAMPVEILRSDDGRLGGVVFVNRSGRQAVRAAKIIDASHRALIARLAGIPFVRRADATRTVERTVIGGRPALAGRDARILSVTTSPAALSWRDAAFDAHRYTLDLDVGDGDHAALSEAEQIARDLTWHTEQAFASESLWFIPPDHATEHAREDRGARAENLFILGACALPSTAAAEQRLRPVASLVWGEALGREVAAARTPPAPPASGLRVAPAAAATGASSSAPLPADARLLEPTPESDGARVADDSAARLPDLGEFDVVVVGGGTGGAAAAIGAARQGARVLCVEFLHALGGVGTLGMVNRNWYGNSGAGFTAEVDAAVAIPRSGARFSEWHVEDKAEWLRVQLRRAGGSLWLHSTTCGVVAGRARDVRGVVVVTPSGRGLVRAKVVIDATGNADVAAAAGAPTRFMGGDLFALQGVGLSTRAPRQVYNNSDWSYVNDSDGRDRTRLLVAGNSKYQSSGYDISPVIASRERRNIVGEHTLTVVDVFRERVFADGVAVVMSNFDQHGYTLHPLIRFGFPHVREVITAIYPYRCMLPQGVDNLLVTALGSSVQRDTLPVTRMQPDIQNQGYAAGIAAALAARDGVAPRHLDLAKLKQRLVEARVLPPEALAWRTTPPAGVGEVRAALDAFLASTAVKDLGALRSWAMVFDAPASVSVPEVRAALARCSDPEKAVWLHIFLAEQGAEDVAPGLLEYLATHPEWDGGWQFKGMDNHGSGYSTHDSVLLALGTLRARAAVPEILRRLGLLDAGSAFSHFHACARAVEAIADPAAAEPLARKIREIDSFRWTASSLADAASKMQVAGDDQKETRSREEALRLILLARALYLCGDSTDHLGRTVLEETASGVDGTYALFARQTLRLRTAVSG
jgi:hypothetical protein